MVYYNMVNCTECLEECSCSYGVVLKLLRSSSVNEFPCGFGSWRIDNTKESRKFYNNVINQKFMVTTKDYKVSCIHNEELKNLLTSKKSPFLKDDDWCSDLANIEWALIDNPFAIRKQEDIFQRIRRLRLINQKITNVDKNMLSFPHLQDLVLSLNAISYVEPKHLPVGLQTLELYGNYITDPVCISSDVLTNLIHLGLGFNGICLLDGLLRPGQWEALYSLDMCQNELTSIGAQLELLGRLQKLRHLCLYGNPLCFSPFYRPLVIDALQSLAILDGIAITADERHRSKGFKQLQDQNEFALMHFITHEITGLPQPNEIANADDFPQYPVITRRYYLELETSSDIQATDGEPSQPSATAAMEPDKPPEAPSSLAAASLTSIGSSGVAAGDASANVVAGRGGNWSSGGQVKLSADSDDSVAKDVMFRRDNLTRLAHYLAAESVPLSLVEEVILSYPEDLLPAPRSPGLANDKAPAKKAHGKTSPERADKEKEKEKEKSKKGKGKTVDLISLEPRRKVLTRFPLDCRSFLGSDVDWAECELIGSRPARSKVFRLTASGDEVVLQFLDPHALSGHTNEATKKKEKPDGRKSASKEKGAAGNKPTGGHAASKRVKDQPTLPDPEDVKQTSFVEVTVELAIESWRSLADWDRFQQQFPS